MFHYVTLYRLKPGVTLDRVRNAREELAALVETLPGVVHFTVTDNLSDRNRGYTLALFSLFESREAFEIFQRHPSYQKVWESRLQQVVEERIIATGEG
ncbi:MAG: Dabb family protein [Planctomycetota bacterium]